MTQELVVQGTDANTLSMDIVKKYICPTATEGEIYMFIQLCKAQNLNPFLKEAYLIKYGASPATIVVGKEAFTKRADKLPQFDGFKAGIIVVSASKIVIREGSFYVSPEEVVGGWAEVYRKDRTVPFRNEVNLSEYIGRKQDGTPTKMWTEKVATMIRKVALCQSLREAFPDVMGGLYSAEEINTIEELPKYEIGETVRLHSGKPATKAPIPKQIESVQIKTNIVTMGKATVKSKSGSESAVYRLTDRDGGVYTATDEGFVTLCKSAKEGGLEVVITHKTDAAKTVEMIDLVEPGAKEAADGTWQPTA